MDRKSKAVSFTLEIKAAIAGIKPKFGFVRRPDLRRLTHLARAANVSFDEPRRSNRKGK